MDGRFAAEEPARDFYQMGPPKPRQSAPTFWQNLYQGAKEVLYPAPEVQFTEFEDKLEQDD